MSDIIDLAQKFEAQHLAQSLRMQGAVAANTKRPQAMGHCLNSECLESFDSQPARLFCGPACAQRFDQISKLNR